MCGGKAQRQRGSARESEQTHREITSNNADKISGSNLVIHT